MKTIKPYKDYPKAGPVAEITAEYRWHLGSGIAPLSYKDFAEELSQPLKKIPRCFSPRTIRNWEKGILIPSDVILDTLISYAKSKSWQWCFARDLRAAIAPWFYTPESEIGKRVLTSGKRIRPTHPSE